MEIYRLQGRVDQIRIEEALPIEIKSLLAEFANTDKRAKELEEARRKRNVEVR